MTRLAWVTTIYALMAALVVAAPLSASEESPPPAAGAEAVEPGAAPPSEAPPPEEPAAEPAPEPQVQPEPQAQPEAQAPPADPAPPPAPDPAASQPEPQELRDEAPVGKPKATAAASASVTIRDFEFAPSQVTVNVGDTVTWSNSGPTPHSATADDGSFDTGIFPEGESRSHTFNQAGTFTYFCTPHPQMQGTVTVQAAGGQDDSGAGDDGSGTGTGSGDSGTTGAADGDSGAALPATGLDTGGLALLGLMTLVLGAYLRRRAAPEAPRPAGRIGW
jgi:plastocyanin